MSKSSAKTAKIEREARQAKALRANLKRRKAPVRKYAIEKPTPAKDSHG